MVDTMNKWLYMMTVMPDKEEVVEPIIEEFAMVLTVLAISLFYYRHYAFSVMNSLWYRLSLLLFTQVHQPDFLL